MEDLVHVLISLAATDGGRSGVSTYVRDLYGALLADGHVAQLSLAATPEAAGASGIDLADPRVTLFPVPRAFDGRAASVTWHFTALALLARRAGADLVHLPVGNRRPGYAGGVPVVATVHDLGELEGNRDYGRARDLYARHVVPQALRLARRIIVISESTRRAVESHMPAVARRARVVPNGVDLSRFHPHEKEAARADVQRALGIAAPYLLYPGRLEHPAKNHLRLIRAFQAARQRCGFPHRLVLAGARWRGAGEIIRAVEDSRGAVRYVGFVEEHVLPALVRGAEVLVFPSLMEGFGLPLVEAMASGTPVLASDATSIPEVVGDAGLIVDCRRAEPLVAALERILGDQALRRRLSEAGCRRAREFAWEACARKTAAVFRGATEES